MADSLPGPHRSAKTGWAPSGRKWLPLELVHFPILVRRTFLRQATCRPSASKYLGV
jgi:hypothetical protein